MLNQKSPKRSERRAETTRVIAARQAEAKRITRTDATTGLPVTPVTEGKLGDSAPFHGTGKAAQANYEGKSIRSKRVQQDATEQLKG